MGFVAMSELTGPAFRKGYAVPSFCAWNAEVMEMVLQTAERLHAPVILMQGPGEFPVLSPASMAAVAVALARRYEVPACLHLDHGDSPQMVRECIDAGYTSVMLDYSLRPFEENVKALEDVVRIARPKGITVEGEIGCIFSVDEKKEVREKEDNLASVPSCRQYFQETGIDALAPAIGTAHGLYKDVPRIDYRRLEEIGRTVSIPMVIHGGTGLTDQDFRDLVKSGAAKINIWTQICIEFCDAMRGFVGATPPSYDPITFTKIAAERIKNKTMELFGTRPRDGLCPTSPLNDGGMRIEPAPSLPGAIGKSPAATALPAPPLEPPAV
jgi:tagatose 1,6-diphosphate aldolase GatY/KbaY